MDLCEKVQDEHVLVLAPRRVGKTSLLREVEERVEREEASVAIYVDVEAVTTELDFVRKLVAAIAKKLGELTPSMSKRVTTGGWKITSLKIPGGVGVDLKHEAPPWQQVADSALAPLFTIPVPVLLMIDELPVFVAALIEADATGARPRAFLHWFRNLRQRPDATGLRFALAGSIGLDNITRKHRLTDTINDLRVWSLGPYSLEIAHGLLRELADSYDITLTPDACDAICDAAGWLIPYHLQLIFSALRSVAKRREVDHAVVAEAVDAVIANRAYFSPWSERLHVGLGAIGAKHARSILDLCANDPAGAPRDLLATRLAGEAEADLAWLLEVLHNDGYIVEAEGRWRFRSGLLRRYWARGSA